MTYESIDVNLSREQAEVESMLDRGEITISEYNTMMGDLQHDAREMLRNDWFSDTGEY